MNEHQRIWIFNQDFEQKGAIDTYKSLIWEEAYQNRGVFTLIVSDTEKNIEFLQDEYFLFMAGKKTAMVIKYRKFNSEDMTIEIHGYTTVELLNQRGLLGTKYISNAEQGMRQIVSENLRGFPRIVQTESKGYMEMMNSQFSNKVMLDIFPEVCAQTELGFILLFDRKNKQHVFDVYKGVDRTFGQHENPVIVFSDEWGTLVNTIIVDDSSTFKNVAYVFGAGEGADRIMEEVGTARGRERYELFVDARDLQPEEGQTGAEYRKNLRARGIAKLNEHNRRTSFLSEANPRDFGVKYWLGDKITAINRRYGITMNIRIMQYKQVIENNMSKIYLTLGEPEITAIGELKLWLG